ncbi:MAG: DUF4360 domain-containing protein [Dactylosporangium sp.]|nr:DUF4360 domain-containing protein [Dactylosporangium sp.]
MIPVLATVGVAVSMLVSPVSDEVAATPTVPPIGQVSAEVVTVNGSGCPIGAVDVTVAEDNASFTVSYGDYLAQVGGDANPTDIRQNCQISLLVEAPGGFTYAIVQADYQGFARLENGVTALQSASYYIQGESETKVLSHSFAGPLDERWHTTDQLATSDLSDASFASCGTDRNLNINTELRVADEAADSDATSSFISMDSMNGEVSATYQFAWKQCS